MFRSNPNLKAGLATVAFLLSAVAGIFYFGTTWERMAPLVLFYLILIINTFFSIRTFAPLVPANDIKQKILDLVLGVLTCVLGLLVGCPLRFVFVALLLFTAAPVKYLLLLSYRRHEFFLQRKIGIDLLGTLSCVLALGGALAGYTFAATYLWAFAFLLANIYLLLIKPMYRIEGG